MNAFSEQQKTILLGVLAVLAVVAAAVALGVVAVLFARSAATPDPTMTGCRPQYGTCTEAHQ